MKRKLLTTVMAATLTVSMAFAAFAAGTPSADGNNPETKVEAVNEVSSSTAEAIKETAKVELGQAAPAGSELKVAPVSATALETAKTLISKTEALKETKVDVVDLKLVDGSDAKVQPTGKIAITLKVEGFAALKAETAKFVAVYRVNDDESIAYLGSVEVKDGAFTFETDHFSTYIFAPAAKAETAPAVDQPAENPTTGDTAPIVPMVVVAIVAAVACILVVSTRKKENN